MNDGILRELLLALDMVVLERVQRGRFQRIGGAPDWLALFGIDASENPSPVQPGAAFSFLESFLEDAEEFWETHQSGELRSGPWSEVTATGRTGALEAVALALNGPRILLLQKRGAGLRENRALLQRARENRLIFERLERAQRLPCSTGFGSAQCCWIPGVASCFSIVAVNGSWARSKNKFLVGHGKRCGHSPRRPGKSCTSC